MKKRVFSSSVVGAVLVAALFLSGFGLTANPAAAQSAVDLEKVTLSLDWMPNTNHTGIYVALDKGWYADEGLALDVQIPADPAAALKQVAFGHTEFGVSFQEEVSIARSQQIPVVSIAAIIQHNTSAFSSLKGAGITSAKDFEGKRYASYGVPLERAVIKGLMECENADINEVEFIDIGFDALPALLGGKVDFAWTFLAWDALQAEIMGYPLDNITLAGSCVPDYYTPLFISGSSTIAERPDTVQKFLAATTRGYEYAIAHPDEAAEILIKYTPETDPTLIRQSQVWLSPHYQDDAPRWGEQQLAVWQGFGDWLNERGLLPGSAFVAEEAFSNAFLPEKPAAVVTPAATAGQ